MDHSSEPQQIKVYHDESGTFGCTAWCLTGLLWVSPASELILIDKLRIVRERYDYWGEIHYCELPSKFSGKNNTDALVARDWLKLYINDACNYVWFNVLAVDTRHKMYDRKRFKRSFQAYNKFTSIAIHSSIKWNFAASKHIKLFFFSDEKTRRPGSRLGDGKTTDNFEEYIVRQLQFDLNKNKRSPVIDLDSPIQTIDIPACQDKSNIKAEEEMLQLCDLLLGSVYSAITASSTAETKTYLGKQIAQLILDTRKEPWKQQYGLHRRLNVNYFPNNNGQMYNDGILNVIHNDVQQGNLF